ncbi:glycoside hydrolase family 71 protein [Laetiporus sulphureus 93-53]|uniref:Glycoside hydrolase family 71 protein n=1 Tax=Laetiporus sulphureus 93-53 TaxID=1314785 RepID=A0A165D0V7_9APHY|nr:glycoside hydrolase family 71 protein [Laetiporus sulphureus 93-53]KZT03908.1 glycoside hydrolase family 71 protein [Laetiporus sulphureus 93-53]
MHNHKEKKWVVAHFMVGNTYPYTLGDWIEDIQLASHHGIDGFALNVGREDWQKARVTDCYEAALRATKHFKLFLSFDMTSVPGSTEADVVLLCDYVSRFAAHPHQLLYHDKVLISTFAGENALFGRANIESAWAGVKAKLQAIAPVHLVPAFLIDPSRYPSIASMDGCFNWNGSWPTHLTPRSPREEIRCPRLETDHNHIRQLGGRTFMAAVSPWFFTHYGPDSWNKNWIYRGDDWLYVRRWEQLVAMRDNVDIVQIISWNDYGESHYIGPIKGAQPNSEAWVDGFPHDAWLRITKYFADAFKTGLYPPIDRDRIFMWARPHLREAHAPDRIPRPANWELTEDAFWVVIFATVPTVVELASYRSEADARTFEVPAGITKLSHAVDSTGSMSARMFREGVLVAECVPGRDGFHFQQGPKVYNFNAYCAMSS